MKKRIILDTFGNEYPKERTKRKPQRDMSGVGRDYMRERDRVIYQDPKTSQETKDEILARWT